MNDNVQIKYGSILALGLVIASLIWAVAFYQSKLLDDTLSVTGSAKSRVKADIVKFSFTLQRQSSEGRISTDHALLARDREAAVAFLEKEGIAKETIQILPPSTDEYYSNDTSVRKYTLRQQITIQSEEVDKITELASRIQDLAREGAVIQALPPEYLVSKLSEYRVSLLAEAVKDARARAEAIATANGRRVGDLKSAASGVVQVLAPNSIDVSDYGQYDTMNLEKDVMVTVRGTFFVK